jgi:hypothetical protein
MTRIRGRTGRQAQAQGRDAGFSREFLEPLARILVLTGHTPGALAQEFSIVCKKLKEPTRRWDAAQATFFPELPHVITHWHSDPQFLDSRGSPIPLPLRGRRLSLATLIERVLPGTDPAYVARYLTRLKGVRRRGGLYVPTGRQMALPRASASTHVLYALLGMLRTVERNVSRTSAAPIFERAATNPKFPVSALPAFHRKLKARASDFLCNVDADMHRREVSSSVGRRMRLGVGVFAFEVPAHLTTMPKSRRRSRNAEPGAQVDLPADVSPGTGRPTFRQKTANRGSPW